MPKTYVVSCYYTQMDPDREIALFEKIERLGGWETLNIICRTQLVQSDLTTDQLYEALIDYFDVADKLFIAEVSLAAWYGIIQEQAARLAFRRPALRPPRTAPHSPEDL